MAETNPPLFLNVDSTYTAASLGLPYRDLVSEGVLGTASLNVSQRGAGANMSVDVAAGTAWIQGDDSVNQPCYRVVNDATKNLSISAAHATNARNDIVIAEVRDSAFSGVNTDWQLRVIAGTAAASPGTPSVPNNAIKLAEINIPATDTTIGDAQITDTRGRAFVRQGGIPACRVYNSSTVAVAHNSFTTITFNSERFDTAGLHSTSTNTGRLTFPVAGIYQVGAAIYWTANSTGIRTMRIMVNGGTALAYTEFNAGAVSGPGLIINTIYSFAAGDYVTFDAYQTSGGSLNIAAGGNYSPEAWAAYLGAEAMI